MSGLLKLSWFEKDQLDCKEVRKASSGYLEGDLNPSKLEKVKAHISGCTPCKNFVESLASMIGMLAKLPTKRSPEGLKQSVNQEIWKDHEAGRSPK